MDLTIESLFERLIAILSGSKCYRQGTHCYVAARRGKPNQDRKGSLNWALKEGGRLDMEKCRRAISKRHRGKRIQKKHRLASKGALEWIWRGPKSHEDPHMPGMNFSPKISGGLDREVSQISVLRGFIFCVCVKKPKFTLQWPSVQHRQFTFKITFSFYRSSNVHCKNLEKI